MKKIHCMKDKLVRQDGMLGEGYRCGVLKESRFVISLNINKFLLSALCEEPLQKETFICGVTISLMSPNC